MGKCDAILYRGTYFWGLRETLAAARYSENSGSSEEIVGGFRLGQLAK